MKLLLTIVITLFLIAVGVKYVPVLKIKSYEREVDSLAFSYRVYESKICPNRKILGDIRNEYMKTVEEGQITKITWINDNFDSRFMQKCLSMNPYRSEI